MVTSGYRHLFQPLLSLNEMICGIWWRLPELNIFHSSISITASGRHYLHHYSYNLFIGVFLLILFDVDILHFNMRKGGIPGFQWTFLVFTLVWRVSESIDVKMNSWIAESDSLFCDACVPRRQPSTRLQALFRESGKTKTPMLLVRHRNQKITIDSTPFSPLWTRSWPKFRIGSVEMTKMFFVG